MIETGLIWLNFLKQINKLMPSIRFSIIDSTVPPVNQKHSMNYNLLSIKEFRVCESVEYLFGRETC